MRPALRTDERGSALVTALLVLVLFASFAFSTVAWVDTQQRESGRERVRESSFALAEGVLSNQIFLLGRQWPTSAALAYPAGPGGLGTCTPASAVDPRCPDEQALEATFRAVDYAAGLGWSTEIHDNAVAGTAQDFYDDAVVRPLPGWDANADGYLWVRAQSTLRGRRRTLVALVRAEELTSALPAAVLVAGKLRVQSQNNRNKVYVEPGVDKKIYLRCGTALGSSGCLEIADWTNLNGARAYPASPMPALSAEAVERLRTSAKAADTWYPTCPTQDKLAGDIVFIEVANCGRWDLSGNGSTGGAWNAIGREGILVIGSGTVEFGGNSTYHGTIYHLNGSHTPSPADDLSGYVVKTQGNTCLLGAVVIDGAGGLDIGASGGNGGASRATPCGDGNVAYSPSARTRFKSYGTAGIVQNSFRELRTG